MKPLDVKNWSGAGAVGAEEGGGFFEERVLDVTAERGLAGDVYVFDAEVIQSGGEAGVVEGESGQVI